MRRFCETLKLLGTGGVLCLGLLLMTADVVLAQPGGQRGPGGGGPGGGGPGGRGGRGGFFGGGSGEPSLSRELGVTAFAEKMNLTEQQKETLNEIDMQRREVFRSMFQGGRGGSSEDQEKRQLEVQAKLKEFEVLQMAVLTVEQKAIWEDRKKEVKAEQEANANNGNSGRPDGGRSRDGGGSSSSTVTQPSTRRTVFSDEKPPEGVAPTASFASKSASATTGTAIADDGAGVAVGAKALNGEATLSFNFRYAPWADVLKLFADAAQLTLDLNEVPPGTFNYYDDKTYTVTEALDVLNGYLLPKGYALIRRDRFLVALNIDNGIPPGLLPTITVDELSKRGMNELLIVDVPLDGFEVDKIVGEVKELTSPWGKVAAMKGTNSLNILDTGSNISRIIRLLKAGTPVGNSETAFRAIALKHISAADAERTIRRLFGLNPAVTSSTPQFGGFGFGGNPQFGGFGGFGGGFGGFRGGDDRGRGGDGRDQQQQQRPQPMASTPSTPSPFAGKIQVTADTRTNHLLVTASASLVKVVEDAVKSIDVDTGKPPVDLGPAFLKAYTVAGGDVTQVATTLNSMLPGLIVGVDTRSSKIHVQGNTEEHAQIERLIHTLAGQIDGSVAVINLTRSDPIQVTNTLRNLFASEVKPPTIEADALGRRLMIRGTAEQLAQVKSLLASLGETGADPNAEGNRGNRGNVRIISPQGRNPEDVLPLMRQMWDAADRAPIRVVIPSQQGPVRDRRVPGGRGFDQENPANTNRAQEGARPTSRPSIPVERSGPTTQAPTRRPSILQVSQTGDRDEAASKSVESSQTGEPQESAPVKPQTETPKRSDVKKPSTEAKVPDPKSPISISIVNGELVVTGDNPEALDQFEEMFNTLVTALPVRTQWTVFYLRSADATDTAQMLERFFPQSSVTASTASSGGMFGSLTGGLSNLGRGMMNVTGLNQTLGGANNLRIITDIRSNALFVSGPKDQIAEVESMLELLDSTEVPASLRDRVPREIAVEHADVEEVAAIVEEVFKDAMTPENQGQQGNQRMNPFAMLMGGGGGGGSGRKEPGIQLTIGVDKRTSHLIVSCNDNLFRQIEGLVTSIDDRARDSRQTVQIMRLETADPGVVSTTLTSLIPKVTVSASRTTRKKPGEQAGQGQPGQGQPGQGADADAMRRAMMNRQGQGGGQQRQNLNGGGGTGRTGGGAGAGGGNRQGGGRGTTGGGRGATGGATRRAN